MRRVDFTGLFLSPRKTFPGIEAGFSESRGIFCWKKRDGNSGFERNQDNGPAILVLRGPSFRITFCLKTKKGLQGRVGNFCARRF